MAKRAARRKPPKTQRKRARKKRAPLPQGYWDATHRPLQCLVFLLPMVMLYEVGMALAHSNTPIAQRPNLASKQLLELFFSLFDVQSLYLPGLLLVVVLLAWHVASRFPWQVSLRPTVAMYGESLILAIPLLLLNNWIPSPSNTVVSKVGEATMLDNLLLSVGAGIYEELVFRLIVITLLTMLLGDVARLRQVVAVALAVILSSLLFAAHHYQPIGADPWSSSSFAFRAAAGAYLAAVFVLRGFGLAVGCHVLYDVMAYML